MGTSKKRSEQPRLGLRSGTLRMYGEHRRAEIGSRSRLLEMPSIYFVWMYRACGAELINFLKRIRSVF